MTTQDLQQIGQLMDEKLIASEARQNKKLDERLSASEARQNKKLDERLSASEARQNDKWEARIEEKLKKTKKEITEDFCLFFQDNILPEFDRINIELGRINVELDKINGKIAQLPTKGYLDEKINNAMHMQNLKLIKEDERVDRFVDVMRHKKFLTSKEIHHINKVRIFPNIPA